jgi:hypothetical protein
VAEQRPALLEVAHEVGIGVLEELPADQVEPSSKWPSARTGFTTGSPYARETAMSSAPKAGDWCTSPVPSSVVT